MNKPSEGILKCFGYDKTGRIRAGILASMLLTVLATDVSSKDEPVAISEYFALKTVAGGKGVYKYQKTDIYALLPGNKTEYVGTSAEGPPGGVGFLGASAQDLRAITMAISKDARAVVFRHWAAKAPRKSKLEAGIYQYEYGHGLKKLLSLDEISGLSYSRWDKPFPGDVMPFRYAATYTPKDLLWGLRTDGERFPLALYQAEPLLRAAFDGRTEDCRALLEAGADIDSFSYWDFTALGLAIIRNHQETAIALLELGADTTVGIYPAFHLAVMLGRMDVVQAMLTQGANINGVDEHGYTPLHLAVFIGSRQVGGVDLFFPNTETPRSLLERGFTTELVRKLLAAGADPEIRDKYGFTPQQVVYSAAPASVKALLIQ